MKILAVDFDGVLHSYTSGWKGPRNIPDPPIPGAIAWLMEMVGTPDRIGPFGGRYDVRIFSSRSRYWGGRRAMRRWLLKHGLKWEWLEEIKFPLWKPPAFLLLDDRAMCFRGSFPTSGEIESFKPYRTNAT